MHIKQELQTTERKEIWRDYSWIYSPKKWRYMYEIISQKIFDHGREKSPPNRNYHMIYYEKLRFVKEYKQHFLFNHKGKSQQIDLTNITQYCKCERRG